MEQLKPLEIRPHCQADPSQRWHTRASHSLRQVIILFPPTEKMCRPLATAFQHDDFSPVPGNKGPLAPEKKRVPEPRRTGVAVDGNVLRKVLGLARWTGWLRRPDIPARPGQVTGA